MKDAHAAAERASSYRELPADLFSGLLAISADAVVALDHEQRIIFFNEGAERIFGWTAQEVVGQYLEILLPERHRAVHRGHVSGFSAAHGRARIMGEREPISGLRRNGEEFPAEASIQRLEVDGHDIYAAVLRDMSARERAEQALRQAVRARDDMLGIVSHDLRNPANAVKMLARSVLERDRQQPLPDDVRENIHVIRQAAEQMDMLIQDLLDVTRLEAGRLTVQRKLVDADWVVTRSVDSMRPLADAGSLTLEAECSGADHATMLADPDRLLQLLSNLIGNAIKFTPAGGTVRVSAEAQDDEVHFIVEDTGQGIADDDLPFVFDRFYQLGNSARHSSRHGAGLGLPIARAIVEAHGGRIWIESDVGVGTRVHFTIALTPA